MDPLDTASGRARGEARGANNARIAGAAAVLRMVREARRAQEQARTNVETLASSRATTQASNVPKPVSPGQAEARMLRDMFQVGHAQRINTRRGMAAYTDPALIMAPVHNAHRQCSPT